MRIRIPGDVWLTFWPCRRFALFEYSLVMSLVYNTCCTRLSSYSGGGEVPVWPCTVPTQTIFFLKLTFFFVFGFLGTHDFRFHHLWFYTYIFKKKSAGNTGLPVVNPGLAQSLLKLILTRNRMLLGRCWHIELEEIACKYSCNLYFSLIANYLLSTILTVDNVVS